eukprot:jgi/Chrzof1/5258/Cz15g19080.t1
MALPSHQHIPIRGKKAGFPTLQNPTHAGCSKCHSHFDHTWHNPQFELTAQLKYLWPNLRLNSKSNPLFKTIQIDLYDPLRIQHESLPL